MTLTKRARRGEVFVPRVMKKKRGVVTHRAAGSPRGQNTTNGSRRCGGGGTEEELLGEADGRYGTASETDHQEDIGCVSSIAIRGGGKKLTEQKINHSGKRLIFIKRQTKEGRIIKHIRQSFVLTFSGRSPIRVKFEHWPEGCLTVRRVEEERTKKRRLRSDPRLISKEGIWDFLSKRKTAVAGGEKNFITL